VQEAAKASSIDLGHSKDGEISAIIYRIAAKEKGIQDETRAKAEMAKPA